MRSLLISAVCFVALAIGSSCKSSDGTSSSAVDDPDTLAVEALGRTQDAMKSFASQTAADPAALPTLRKAYGHYRAGARAFSSGRHGTAIGHALRARAIMRDAAQGSSSIQSVRIKAFDPASIPVDSERERATQRGDASTLDSTATREESDLGSDQELAVRVNTTTLTAECERFGRSCNTKCTPRTCTEAAATCGLVGDGCGGILSCGTCSAPATCGGGGKPSSCGVPTGSCVAARTCKDANADCGIVSDGCGGVLNCGTCAVGEVCGGGSKPNRCASCKALSCAQANATCGIVADGCGGTLSCGICTAPETCGGGGVPNKCGGTCNTATTCVPKTVADFPSLNCGPVSDGCGGILQLGSCAAPLSCGGGGVASQCGGSCVPKTCATLAATAGAPSDCSAASPPASGCFCGLQSDGCGALLQCGSCPAPETCGGGGVGGRCGGAAGTGCTPKTCASIAATAGAPSHCGATSPAASGCYCGPAADACGGLLDCGACPVGETCGGGGIAGRCGSQ